MSTSASKPRRVLLASSLVAIASITAALGLAGCFDSPAAEVLFSCTPGSADACPEGYSCEADGCCHKDGTSVPDHFGECALAGDGGTGQFPGTDTGGDTDTGGETDTDSGTGSGSGSGS